MLQILLNPNEEPLKPTYMEQTPGEIKLTLWKKTGKKADGTEFVSFSTSSPLLTGVDSWINGYRRTANTKDGPVDVIDLVIKPKAPRPDAPKSTSEIPF